VAYRFQLSTCSCVIPSASYRCHDRQRCSRPTLHGSLVVRFVLEINCKRCFPSCIVRLNSPVQALPGSWSMQEAIGASPYSANPFGNPLFSELPRRNCVCITP
jgi:hypothetical protein